MPSEDITFCISKCNKKKCFRHPSNIKLVWMPHSFMDLKGADDCEMKDKEKGGAE